ncbi:unnamed protein product [Schistosoma turkestanicum]|nr:unnamed protein product [Schistosoma turkestanicum]
MRIKQFLKNYKLKAVTYKSEKLERVLLDIWDKILKTSDINLVEDYMEMRINLGMVFNPDDVSACLKEASINPTQRTFACFIRQSCVAGDIEKANLYLRLLKESGANPNMHTFSYLLHGYIKAGLPDEMTSLQQKLSDIGLWPSRIGYEAILSAYADLGDESSLMKTLNEALTVLQPIKINNAEQPDSFVFSTSFILDIYTKLICSKNNPDATCCELLTRTPLSLNSNNSALNTVKILLARGYTAAALEIFKMIHLNQTTTATDTYLRSLLRFAILGGLKEEELQPFWKLAARDDSQLQMLVDETKSFYKQCATQQSENRNQDVIKNPEDTTSPKNPSFLELKLSLDNVVNPVVYACQLFRETRHFKVSFQVKDIEQIFWKSVENQSSNEIATSIKSLTGLFILTKDYDGLRNFLHRIVSDIPAHTEHFFSRKSITALLTEHTQENWDLLVSILKSKSLCDKVACTCIRQMLLLRSSYPELNDHPVQPSWASESKSLCDKVACTCIRQMLLLRSSYPELNDHPVQPSWASEILFHRIQNDDYALAFTRLHYIIKSYCRRGSFDIIDALKQKALENCVLLSPKTLATIICTPYFIQRNLSNYNDLIFDCHECIHHDPVNLNQTTNHSNTAADVVKNSLKHFDSLIQISSNGINSHEIIDRTVNWLVEHIPCDLFAASPASSASSASSSSPSTSVVIPTWLILCQRLLQTNSLFNESMYWTQLALKWFEQVDDNHVKYLDCFKNWYNYAPNKNTSVALLIAGLLHVKSREWALSVLSSENNDIIYDIIVSDSINQLTDEHQHCFAEIMSQFGKTNTLAIARQLHRNGFDAPTLQYIINKLPAAECMNELAQLCITKSSWLIPMSNFISEHYPDEKLTFFRNLLTLLRTKSIDRENLNFIAGFIKDSINLSELEPTNEWFLRIVLKPTDSSQKISLIEWNYVLSRAGLISSENAHALGSAIYHQNYKTLIGLLKNLDETTLENIVPLAVYFLALKKGASEISRLLFCITENRLKKLLPIVCKYSQPLMLHKLQYCFLALDRYHDGLPLDWLSLTGLKFFDLQPTEMKQKEQEQTNSTHHYLSLLPSTSMADISQSLVNLESSHKPLGYILASIGRSSDSQKKLSLLYQLVNLGADSLIRTILRYSSKQEYNTFYPLSLFAFIIRTFSNPELTDIQNTEKINQTIETLTNLSSNELMAVICHPYMDDTLFRCWPTKHITNFVLVILITLALLSLCVLHPFIWLLINRQTRLTPGTTVYTEWKEPSVPIFMQFYFFNLTNPIEFQAGAKPHVQQLGPYTYHEKRVKTLDLSKNTNGTINYKEMKWYYFDQNLSNGTENDSIINVNLAFISVAEKLHSMPWIIVKVIEWIEKRFHEYLFRPKTVNELLWGYEDELLTYLSSLGIQISTKIGFFIHKNNTLSENITIDDGVQHNRAIGQILKYAGNETLSYWTTETANMINGTDGTLFHPFITKNDTPYIFASDICRSLQFTFDSIVEFNELPTYKFIPQSDIFKSSKYYEKNKGFCLNWPNCFEDGVLDMSSCQPGAPIAVSQPHFLNANKTYQNAIEGLYPTDEFNTVIYLEPNTGSIIKAEKKLQINILVKNNPNFKQLKNISTTLLPIMFINESVQLNETLIDQLVNALIQGPFIAKTILICFISLTLIILCSIISVHFYHNQRISTSSYTPFVNDNQQSDEHIDAPYQTIEHIESEEQTTPNVDYQQNPIV